MVTNGQRLDALEAHKAEMEKRMSNVENTLNEMNATLSHLDSVASDVRKIWRATKYVTSAVLPTLVAAGYVNGTFAEILSKIFGINT